MALMEANFHSKVLGLACNVNVILPQKMHGIGVRGSDQPLPDRFPVLWLLHGASDDHTIWLRNTSIERYVSRLGLAVVMPAVHLSSYTNMVHGARYFDYITDELPAIMREFFPLSDKREDNFVAGLSMGGYGALKIGLSKPENYSAIGCFSAGNFTYRKDKSPVAATRASGLASRTESTFGVEDMNELRGTIHDHFWLAEKAVAENKPLPRIFHACGTEDFLIDNARLTANWFKNSKFDYEYHEGPGAHTWEFWDEWIQKYLAWLLKK